MRYGIIAVFCMLSLVTSLNGQNRSVKDLFEQPRDKAAESAEKNKAGSVQTAVEVPEIATVNGRAVERDEFYRVLYASAGMRVLRQLVGLELAKQMADAEGIRPTQADFDAEYKRVTDRMGPEKDALGKVLTQEDRQRILKAVLERRGVSVEEFEIGIRHQAYLKAIVKRKIAISEEMIQEEFKRVYGPRRTIRIIAVADMKLGEGIYNRLVKGEDFAKLAEENSIDFNSAPIGGQLGEITKNDPRLPLIVTNTAYNLKVGKFSSPVKVNSQFWIIKVDQESTPKPITLDKVKDQLQQDLHDRLESEMIEKLETQLFKNAKIKVYDKPLSQQFNLWMDQLKTRKQ